MEPHVLAAFVRNFDKRRGPSVRWEGCWEWNRGRDKDGYGKFWLDGRTEQAHRVAWETFRGPIPDGKIICHHCDNPPCVNPDHLFLGTHLDNTLDAEAKGRRVACHSDEANEKRSGSMTGIKRSDETRAKMAAAAKKRWQNPDYREKWSKTRTGQKRSDEARRKMSEAARRRAPRRRDPETGHYL